MNAVGDFVGTITAKEQPNNTQNLFYLRVEIITICFLDAQVLHYCANTNFNTYGIICTLFLKDTESCLYHDVP